MSFSSYLCEIDCESGDGSRRRLFGSPEEEEVDLPVDNIKTITKSYIEKNAELAPYETLLMQMASDETLPKHAINLAQLFGQPALA